MVRIQNEASFITALISIFLYSSLAITCFYFANRFWDSANKRLRQGLYVAPKFCFFVVLGISAVFDLPAFIACASQGGPDSCSWEGVTYDFCWCMHILATIGQLYAVITPSILWSDIIHQKDGNFWNSASQLDPIKRFFRLAWVLYAFVTTMTVIGKISYPSSDTTQQVSYCLMPIMLVLVAAGCLYSGVSLQRHVMKVQFGTKTQRRFLLQLNFLMIFITCSYAIRAILVLSLFDSMPQSYVDAFNGVGSYAVWLPLTQWLPFVFCSFCLVNNMRFKGGGTSSGKNGESMDTGSVDGIGMSTVNAYLESNLEPSYSTSERGTDASDIHSPFDHHSHASRSTAASVDGFRDRSISYLLSQSMVGDQSLTTRLHRDTTASNHPAPGANRATGDMRESDVYSAFGGGERGYSVDGFDTYRESSISAATNVDNFFAVSALQRPISSDLRQKTDQES